MKNITILGATGSIGQQCLDIVAQHCNIYSINYLTTYSNTDILEQQCSKFRPKGVVIVDEVAFKKFKQQTQFQGIILCGETGLIEAASDTDSDIVVVALVGFAGVKPTINAIKKHKTIALANKETLVVAGQYIMNLAKENNANILPVDSEHSAIFQVLQGESADRIDKLILTASGGPFFNCTIDELQSVTSQQALQHPTWQMGSKVTIDSATMMNKGFEVIEAHWLFGVPADKIEVLVHKQSIVHSMVQFVDGSIKAQLSTADMRIPIAYALSCPDRLPNTSNKLDFTKHNNFEFLSVPRDKFKCLDIAYFCLQNGGNTAAIANAANEIAVKNFINNTIGFLDIPQLIYFALDKLEFIAKPTLDDLFDTDSMARIYSEEWIKHH